MRRFFKLLPVLLVLAVAVVILTARFLPTSRTLERRLIIRADPAEVYDRVARIRGWRGWYVPPDMGRFEGPEYGAGGTLILEDAEAEEVRRLAITRTSSPAEVVYQFPDEKQTPFHIEGSFGFQSHGPGQTAVLSRQRLRARADDASWMAAAGERWFLYLFADRFVGSILERELHNLKGAVEGGPGYAPPSLPLEVQ